MNISSIEYTRRYAWKTLAVGAAFSLVLFMEPFLRPIFSRAFIAGFEAFVSVLFPSAFWDVLPVLPLLIAVVAFAIQARTGFNLRGPGIDALYLPSKFREAIAFIRSAQDGQFLRRKDTYEYEQQTE
jgi:hypothetical protein